MIDSHVKTSSSVEAYVLNGRIRCRPSVTNETFLATVICGHSSLGDRCTGAALNVTKHAKNLKLGIS